MSQNKELIINLVENAVFSVPLPEGFPSELSLDEAETLYRVSKGHDLAQLVASSLKTNRISIPAEVEEKFQKQLFMSVFRCEKLQYELNRLSDALENAKIMFVPLKGSILRPYYPESWMRTSCDIDLFIKIEDLDRVADVLIDTVGYRVGGQWKGERSFHSPDGIHLEVHFFDEADKEEGLIFQEIWDHVSPAAGFSYRMQMEWEYFYVHHVMHMAKHFSHGGCGIRPFLDLALMRDKIPMDLTKRIEYLEQFDLTPFAEASERLSSVWFGNESHIPLTEQMQEYLFGAGIYGSVSNQVAIEKSGYSKHLSGILAHVWLPFHIIKHQYPVLLRHKWLMPYFQIHRWMKLIFCGGLKRSWYRINENRSISDEKVEKVASLMEQLKLV